jgi:hypothetical protein
MRLRTSLLALLAFVCGCASAPVYERPSTPPGPAVHVPPGTSRIAVEGEIYRRLTGAALRRAIIGTSMYVDARDVVTSGDGAFFSRDGHSYAHNRDRVQPASGTYSVLGDRVCTEILPNRWCFALFRSHTGGFMVADFADNSMPTRVILTFGTPIDGGNSRLPGRF